MSPYAVTVPHSVRRRILDLPADVRARVLRGIANLRDDPRPVGSRKLAGSAQTYRIRIGDYRVLYEIDDGASEVFIVACGHRRDVYR